MGKADRTELPACSCHTHNAQRNEHDEHGRQDGPALTGVPDHLAERVGERGRDEQQSVDIEEVGYGRRILEGMSGIGVEEPAAVRTQHLDGDLRCGRPESDDLVCDGMAVGVFGRLQEPYRRVRAERLDDALRYEKDRENRRQRQEDVERGARQIDPEIAQMVGRLPRDSAK
jgi:hypothetical protein